jgi:hypothetical protein
MTMKDHIDMKNKMFFWQINTLSFEYIQNPRWKFNLQKLMVQI